MKIMLYTIAVWAKIGIDPEDGEPYISKRDAEKQIFKLLSKSEMDCDVELMNAEEVDE